MHWLKFVWHCCRLGLRLSYDLLVKGIALPGDSIYEVENLLKLLLSVRDITTADSTASHPLRRAHGLFVNDSIKLACALRLGLADLVTHDADFARVPLIRIWQPTDV